MCLRERAEPRILSLLRAFLLPWSFHQPLLWALHNCRAQVKVWGLRLHLLRAWALSDVWSSGDTVELSNPLWLAARVRFLLRAHLEAGWQDNGKGLVGYEKAPSQENRPAQAGFSVHRLGGEVALPGWLG